MSESDGTDTKDYLFDRRNHTGFAQVLEAYVNDQLEKVFQIGHDVISQADVSDPLAQEVLTLLADGHGSTRGLIDQLGDLVQQYAYDAYGNMLSGTGLTTADAALTNLLYSGEWTLADGQQYLRARLYDPASGTFNRLDPFFGNLSDPQSLHKYLYTHANPVAFSDPSGRSALGFFLLGTPGKAVGAAAIAMSATDLSAAFTAVILDIKQNGYISAETQTRVLFAAVLVTIDVILYLTEFRNGGSGPGSAPQLATAGGPGVGGTAASGYRAAMALAITLGMLHMMNFAAHGGFPPLGDGPGGGRGGDDAPGGGGRDGDDGPGGGRDGDDGPGGGGSDGPGGGPAGGGSTPPGGGGGSALGQAISDAISQTRNFADRVNAARGILQRQQAANPDFKWVEAVGEFGEAVFIGTGRMNAAGEVIQNVLVVGRNGRVFLTSVDNVVRTSPTGQLPRQVQVSDDGAEVITNGFGN